jgi:hypothetical protein
MILSRSGFVRIPITGNEEGNATIVPEVPGHGIPSLKTPE